MTAHWADVAHRVDTGMFREAFRGHPAGVAVVTAQGPEGPVGLTASSVASVSVDPPALSFSLSSRTTAPLIAAAPTMVVHLMDSAHVDTVRTFATPGSARFSDPRTWEELPTGEPLLHRSSWALRCKALDIVPVGSSSVVVAEVIEIFKVSATGEPLVYHDRSFHSLGSASLLPHAS